MLFNSYGFLIFFPIVTLVYYLIPHKVRYIWLLITSYFFYMCWNAKYALLLLGTTVVTYFVGLGVEKFNDKNVVKNLITTLGVLINLSLLFIFKYLGFAVKIIDKINYTLGGNGIGRQFDIVLPVGISFFIFQAIGYTIDVYRGKTKAERNFFLYALFVSFFPQLVAGPIERSSNLLPQFKVVHKFDGRVVKDGLLRMLWGFFLKLVIADRIAIFVDLVYREEYMARGSVIILATVLFAIQIYCDFAGYSTIAIGAAKVMGFNLMENFDTPYMADSVAGFWRRWHISLTGWFRDYLYIPLGGSRCSKLQKWINIMIVFGVSGLWHGANYTYIIWGLLNGFYQVIGEILSPVKNFFAKIFSGNILQCIWKGLCILVSDIMVTAAWMCFRAQTLAQIKSMVGRILGRMDASLLAPEGIFEMGFSKANFVVMIIAIIGLVVADILKYNGVQMREKLLDGPRVIRWAGSMAMVLIILVFGIWGSGYEATNFIYFQF